MIPVADQLEEIEEQVMSGLKDFQQATVNRIDELFRSGQMRILVSDEVGLGKTLIARGTIARFARMRHDVHHDKLVKVIYVCSNAAIAGQNLNKLKISQDIRKEDASYSRLSMQHLNIFSQENDEEIKNSYIQLIPMTPDTSFRVGRFAGTQEERALMYAFLRRLPELQPYKKSLEKAMERDAVSGWNAWSKGLYESQVKAVDKKSNGQYISYMLKALDRELSRKNGDGITYREELIQELERLKAIRYREYSDAQIIGHLRTIFANISMEKLEPDLVIMDEFQRFKYLINADPSSDTGMLAHKFFNSKKVRMLLLSATPYKMYTTLEEMDEASDPDEYYKEFLDVMKFLNVTDEADMEFRKVWSDYSVELQEFSRGETSVIEAKNAAENAMYQSICRTERISASENADIIDDSDVKDPVSITEQDVRSFLDVQNVLEYAGLPYNTPIDYIKSAPYLFSFMKDYQLKRDIERYFKRHPDEVGRAKGKNLWIDRRIIDRYEKIPSNNARLEDLISKVFQQNAEKLLWVPPSRPYYDLQGVFKGSEHFTKTLVFSSWEMVPRMISCMVSYEAERRNYVLLKNTLKKSGDERDIRYFNEGAKGYPQPRMNFTYNKKDDRLSGMALFCLLYPSKFLAEAYDPIDCMNRSLSLREIEKEVKLKIKERISDFSAPQTGAADNSWYYLAPMFMDSNGYADAWLESVIRHVRDDKEDMKRQEGYLRHLDELEQLYYDNAGGKHLKLGKMPSDLVDVLCDMAIASPAVSIRRSYKVYEDENRSSHYYMPTEFARLFINRMNTVESTYVVEVACGRKSDDAHWQNVLTYCKQGNLQAVLDEYIHLCASGMDDDETLIEKIHASLCDSMGFRTTRYNVDTYNDFKKRCESGSVSDGRTNIRTNFAVAFTKGVDKASDTRRKENVRNAFNSPFRPFVLSSTSIGQEGLDFHNYCRRIVHWNLPSNPIDIEQREGRINRFECLAIRQNIAMRYGQIKFKRDVWAEMFAEAVKVEKTDGCSDLIPYWGLKESPDMIKIERVVPMYPFSKDEISYDRLIRILSLYRLTLGQARQEELLEYIFKNHSDDLQDLKKMFINLSPYYRTQDKR